jgi:hypothetical protein
MNKETNVTNITLLRIDELLDDLPAPKRTLDGSNINADLFERNTVLGKPWGRQRSSTAALSPRPAV